MQNRFWNENTIYLYCTVSKETYRKLLNGLKQNCMPLTLYETPEISRRMTHNSSNMVTLRVAVCIAFVNGQFYYDELIMDKGLVDNIIKSAKMQGRIKNVNDLKCICTYARTLAKMEQNGTTVKRNVIEYRVNDPRILINVRAV